MVIRILQYNNDQGIIKIDTKFFQVFYYPYAFHPRSIGHLGILSNIIGNVSLAEQINYGVMHSIYTALGIAISVHIVTAIMITLLYSRFANVLLIVRKEEGNDQKCNHQRY